MSRVKSKGPAACGSASRAKGKGQASSATFRKSKSLSPELQEILNRVSKGQEDGTLHTSVYDGMRQIGFVGGWEGNYVAFLTVGGSSQYLGRFSKKREAAHEVSLADRLVNGPGGTGTVQ